MPELILTLKGRELKRLAFTKPELTIGRDPTDDLYIENIGISRSHVKIRVTSQGDIFAMDNQSRNGTFINGQQIKARHKLRNGDTIQLAKYAIEFSQNTGPRLDNHKLREAAKAQKEQPKANMPGTQGTLTFSTEEIQSIIKAGEAEKSPAPSEPSDPLDPMSAIMKRQKDQKAPPAPAPPKGSKGNQQIVILGMIIVILLLLLILIILLKRT